MASNWSTKRIHPGHVLSFELDEARNLIAINRQLRIHSLSTNREYFGEFEPVCVNKWDSVSRTYRPALNSYQLALEPSFRQDHPQAVVGNYVTVSADGLHKIKIRFAN